MRSKASLGQTATFPYIRAAVLAPRCGGVQIIGEASRAGLRWGRFSEHRLAHAGNNELVRRDDEEIDDRHKNDEVDNSGNKRPKLR